MDRRRFLKYAGAAGLAVAGCSFVAYELQNLFPKPSAETATSQTITSQKKRTPVTINARFSYMTPQRSLGYIAPNSGEEIEFTNETDVTPVSSPVSYEWTIDGAMVANSRHYSSVLPETRTTGLPHAIMLTARSGASTDTDIQQIDVDPQNLPEYGEENLGIPIKGMNLNIGYSNWWNAPVSEQEMTESLHVIRNELNCNAIRICGDFEEALAECTELAVEKEFDIVLLSPRYRKTPSGRDVTIEEHVRKVIDFSKRAERLRQSSGSSEIILVVGNELCLDTVGIYDGPTYEDRQRQISENWRKPEYFEKLNFYLKQIVDGVRQNFRGRITYAKGGGGNRGGGWENVKWNELGFDIVSSNEYMESYWFTRDEQVEAIQDLQVGKPVFVTEYGCATYEGAGQYGAGGDSLNRFANKKYSQEEQARYIIEAADLYRAAGVDGIFHFTFVEKKDDDAISSGILEYRREETYRRKLGFWALQSLSRPP